jgi:hypothetical protein
MALIRIKRSKLNRILNDALFVAVLVLVVVVVVFFLVEVVQCFCGNPDAIESLSGRPMPK